jgi:hypothetical protein
MMLFLHKKRYNIHFVSLLLYSILSVGILRASPPGGGGGSKPPGNLPVVNKPPVRVGNRLYWTPACPIVAQTFNNSLNPNADANGSTVDTSSVGWYLDASKVPNAVYFAIKSHRIKAETLGGVGVWYSNVFNIAGYTGIQVDAKISSEGTFTSSEYMTVGYILNGGPEVDIETVTGSFGNDSTPTVTSPQLTGNTVQIVVHIYNTTAGNSDYYIEQYDVFKEVGPCTVTSGITVSATAGNSGVLTCANPSTTLSASTTATGTTTYSWTGPSGFTATGASVTATTAGTYTVTGTNSAGTGTATVAVTSNTTPPAGVTATASGTLTCSTTAVTLTGSSTTSGATFAWTGPNSFSATGATTTAHMAGTYTLTATNPTTGCTSTTTVAVASNTTAPTNIAPTVSGPLTCTTTSVTLSGSSSESAAVYTWTGPNSFTATGATATATAIGTYTLTATDPTTGCWGSTTVAVTSNTTPPAGLTATASGSLSCTATSVTLTGSSTTSGATFAWTGPSGFTATGATATVTVPGTYTVTATNPSTGCTATASTTVTQNLTAPADVTATNNGPLTCSVTSVMLSGSSTLNNGVTYAWTGPGNFTATGASATATVPGTYTLTATYTPTGCTSTATTTVTGNTTAPAGLAIAAANNVTQLSCNTNFTTLSGSSTTSGVTYSWSGPDNFTATTSAVNVFNAGTYTMTVTNPTGGCTASASIAITQNVTPPAGVAIAPSLAALTCSDPSATLTGSSTTSGVSYAWTGPSSFTATGTTVTAVTPGEYVLTVTEPTNGCTTSTAATVTANFAPPADVTAINNGPQTCLNVYVALTGSSTTSGTTFAWTGPNGFTVTGATTNLTSLGQDGTYTLTATNPANGCTAIATTVVAADYAAPTGVSVSSSTASPVLNCTNTSLTLTASSSTPGVTYAWRIGPIGSTIGTGATLTVSQPDQYDVLVTNPENGCAFLGGLAVTQNVTVPSVALTTFPGSAVLTCSNPSVALTGTSSDNAAIYSWTGPGGFTASSAAASTSTPGSYTLTVTDPTSGCSATAATTIAIDTATPTAVTTSSVPANAVLTCSSPDVVLTGSSGTSGVTYSWAGPDGFSFSGAVATVATPGSYVLTVSNPGNGCSTAVTANAVTQNIVVPVGVTANASNKITCSTTTTTLTGNSTTTGATYTWAGPGGFTSSAKVATATLGGVYTLTAINPANGCTTSKTVTVVADTATPAGVTATNTGELTCDVTTVTLTGSSTTAGVSYIWTGPDGYFDPEQISSMATDSGTYVLTVINSENGCTTTATTYVAQDLSECSAIKPKVTTGQASSFNDSTATAFTYKVYPNPVSNTTAAIEFLSPTAAQVSVEIYSNAGVREQLLFANSVGANQSYRLTLNPGGLPAGVHYCVIRVNGKLYTSKILVLP